MQIFLTRNGQQDGPFSLEQIRGQIRSNLLLMSTPAWVEGWEDWKTVTDIPGLIEATPSVLPPAETATQTAASLVTTDTREVLWEGRPAWRNYATHLALGTLTIPLFGLGLLFILWAFLDRRTRHYTVTRRSVILASGLIFKSTDEVMLRDIRSVVVARKGISALFGLATVEFSSAARDGSDIVFMGITDSEKVRNLVNDLRA